MIRTNDTPDELDVLPQITGYRVIDSISRGGQSTVYCAEREATGTLVALKVLADPTRAVRLRREAEFLARISHTGVVDVIDTGVLGATVYLVTDLVEGFPIDGHVNAYGLDVDGVLDLLIDACRAVAAAHTEHVLHRDLKPGNILVTTDGLVRIIDFGLATDDTPGKDSASTTGSIVGTVDYVAPERLLGEPATVRSDVYGLGVVLYELLADAMPYDGAGRLDLARNIVSEKPVPLRVAAAGDRLNESIDAGKISRDLEAVVMKAIAKDPEWRYATVESFAEDMERIKAGLPVAARYHQRGYVTRRLLTRHRSKIITAGVCVATLAFASVWTTYAWRRAERAVVDTQIAFDMASRQYSGDLARGKGSIQTAIGNYVASLQLAENLGSDSQRLQLQRYNAHYRLAELYFDEGDVDNARAHAESAIALAPGLIEGRTDQTQSASMHVLIGKIAMLDQLYDDAATAFLTAATKYVATAPDPSYVAHARTLAGRALEKAGQSGASFAEYTAAISLYETLTAEHPANDPLKIEIANAEVDLSAWHLRRKTQVNARAALDVIERAMERLDTVTDEAVAHDAVHVRTLLERNRVLAAKRIQRAS